MDEDERALAQAIRDRSKIIKKEVRLSGTEEVFLGQPSFAYPSRLTQIRTRQSFCWRVAALSQQCSGRITF